MAHDCASSHCEEECVRERCELFDLDTTPEDVDLWTRTYLDIEAFAATAPTEPRWLPLAA